MIRTLIGTLALSLTLVNAAAAGPTAQQKCEGAKVTALAMAGSSSTMWTSGLA